MKIPLVGVQVAANSLTEHLHVTRYQPPRAPCRHEQLITQVHGSTSRSVVRALATRTSCLGTNSQGSGRVAYQVFFSSIPALVESAYFFIAARVAWSVLTSFAMVHIAGTQQVLKRRTEVRQSRREPARIYRCAALRASDRHILRQVPTYRLVLAVIIHLLQLRYATVIPYCR